MTKITDIPAIRFKGFSDTWEQRKAIDIADYSKGNGYSKGDLTDAGTPIILYGRLYTKYQFAISEVDTFAVPRNGAVYSQGNEVIVPASGETAEDIARASAVEKSGVLLGGDLNILRPFDFINPLFLALAISNGEPQKELAKKAQGKSVVHIHNTDIQEVTIAYPSRTEQDRIVSVFRQLDNLITLHQRKYDKLTNVKKSMLEKMFPQNGSNVPEIRFKGFTEAWEQRKVSELFKVTRGYVLAATLTEPAKTDEMPYPVYSSQTKDNGLMGYYKDYLYEDAITWTTDGANAGTVNYRAGKFYCTNVCGVLLSNEVTANQMIAEALNNVAKGYVSYVGNPKLMNNVMADIEIMIPTHAEEREKLSVFFRNLDTLITLHQREFAFLCKEKSKKFRYIKNAWEQRKFDEVFDCTVPNNTLSRAELSYDEGTVLNVHYGDVLIKYGSVLDVQKDDIPRIPYRCREDFNGALLQDGDVIIADTAEDETTGKACEIGNLQGRAIVSGLHTMVCRPRHRMALGYLGHYLNSNAYHHQLLPLMQGIKVLSLSRSNIQKTSVSYPTVEKEQQLIANYFSQLDNLITLHQRKPNFYTGGYYAE